MRNSVPRWKQIQNVTNTSGLSKAFTEVMLWGTAQIPSLKIQLSSMPEFSDFVWNVEVLAELQGAFMLDISDSNNSTSQIHKQLDRELQKRFPERILRFKGVEKDFWYWPKRLSSGVISHERVEVSKGVLPDFICQRLSGISFTTSELSRGVSPVDVRDKLRGKIETAKITKDFYVKFSKEHEKLTKSIHGLSSTEASGYATLLLNRLMFIYFLQKKEFLNGDSDYLHTCLLGVKNLSGDNKFYNFYKDYLLQLFFHKLNTPNGSVIDENIRNIIGDVPYINGGLFGASATESRSDINIPDSAFESILNFFASFTWHLDTRPTGASNEINPEVIGYIFEQYINFTAGGKKENGAYYTQQDVSGYMIAQTLVPKFLDLLEEHKLRPLELAKDNPIRYMQDEVLHGAESSQNTLVWKQAPEQLEDAWKGDPDNWRVLDEAPRDQELLLPGESWVEMFHRRSIAISTYDQLLNGKINIVDDIITLNLNGLLLATDCIEAVDDSKLVSDLWNATSKLSIIDPTCGSGAFLFAAIEVLEDFYGSLADKANELGREASYIVDALLSHPNRRYFLRKQASLQNIYGVDLMPDAIETAKLRIFLALASCLESKKDIEPLPDLDFNLKCGNLLVGFTNSEDAGRISNDLITYAELEAFTPELETYSKLLASFISGSNANGSLLDDLKSQVLTMSNEIQNRANEIYVSATRRENTEIESWTRKIRPFHWFLEFPEVMKNGGFDVIVGNPPYIGSSGFTAEEKSDFIGFRTLPFKDIYEVCLERTLSLLSPKGRHAFVIMSSLARGNDFSELRNIIFETGRTEWWSTYSIRPASLFTGIKVRNTILILGSNKFKKVHSTVNCVFTSETRKWLFPCLQYYSIQRQNGDAPLRGGVANQLAAAIGKIPSASGLPTETNLYFRNSGKYWYPVLLGESRTFDVEMTDTGFDSVAKSSKLYDFENKKNAIALLGGKLGFFAWSLVGDDFNVSGTQTLELRKTLSSRTLNGALSELGSMVYEAALSAVVLSEYRSSFYPNVNWSAIRNSTDRFDKGYLTLMGLENHWRDLNIWYRQVMKMTREDTQRVNLSKSEAKEKLGWG